MTAVVFVPLNDLSSHTEPGLCKYVHTPLEVAGILVCKYTYLTGIYVQLFYSAIVIVLYIQVKNALCIQICLSSTLCNNTDNGNSCSYDMIAEVSESGQDTKSCFNRGYSCKTLVYVLQFLTDSYNFLSVLINVTYNQYQCHE